jgi:hypothetical protein
LETEVEDTKIEVQENKTEGDKKKIAEKDKSRRGSGGTMWGHG